MLWGNGERSQREKVIPGCWLADRTAHWDVRKPSGEYTGLDLQSFPFACQVAGPGSAGRSHIYVLPVAKSKECRPSTVHLLWAAKSSQPWGQEGGPQSSPQTRQLNTHTRAPKTSGLCQLPMVNRTLDPDQSQAPAKANN